MLLEHVFQFPFSTVNIQTLSTYKNWFLNWFFPSHWINRSTKFFQGILFSKKKGALVVLEYYVEEKRWRAREKNHEEFTKNEMHMQISPLLCQNG